MQNIEFNQHTPSLVAQLILASSLDKTSKNTLPKEFYSALLSSATIMKAMQNLPGDKQTMNLLTSSAYSLENVFKLIEESGDKLLEVIMDDLALIIDIYSQNCESEYFTDPIVREYMTEDLFDAIYFLRFELRKDSIRYQEVLQGLNYAKTKEKELLKSFSIFSKYI